MTTARAPFGPHAASPAELKDQLRAERLGKPYLMLRDGDGNQRIVSLVATRDAVTVGRMPSCDLALAWDPQVSRAHAQLERLGEDWAVVDDGLSRNGTLVNGERLVGRRRLRDGDCVRFGTTDVVFRAPGHGGLSTVSGPLVDRPALSEAQRQVLIALCRPYGLATGYAAPASNREVAAELYLSVETVKTHLRSLFHNFGVGDLQQNAKRARLVELAFATGAVSRHDVERPVDHTRTTLGS